jgi:NCAIR mutase (PurE)-related protein
MKDCLRFAEVDIDRFKRRGFPEVIYSPGKTPRQIELIAKKIIQAKQPLLITKADKRLFQTLKRKIRGLKYNALARAIYLGNNNESGRGKVLIVTAGTTDIPVAEEAALTLQMMGQRLIRIYDVGVAGLNRILKKRALLNQAAVVIVAAGMDGALASVVSGLISKPVIALPTSCGYGANFKGLSALLTMLNSCSPGIGVVNIDNGFGAGYLAALINGLS